MKLLRLDENHLPWAAYLLLVRIFHWIKSRFVGLLIGAPGIHLGPGCVIRGTRKIQFGQRFSAHSHLWLEAVVSYRQQRFSPQIVLGNDVSASDSVHITCINRIVIGNRVLIGSGVYISDHNHGRYKGKDQSSPQIPPAIRDLCSDGPIVIGDDVWIGDNVVIVGPVSIAAGSILAANSVVRRDALTPTILAGVPAVAIKQWSHESNQWTATT